MSHSLRRSPSYPPLDLRPVAPPGVRLTNDGLPLPVGLRDLVGRAHLAEGRASNDEDHDAWPSAVLAWGLILVPVAITGTAREGEAQSKRVAYQCYSSSLFHHCCTEERMCLTRKRGNGQKGSSSTWRQLAIQHISKPHHMIQQSDAPLRSQ